MSDTTPPNLTADHLVYAVLPDAIVGEPVTAELHYSRVISRIDTQISVGELWTARFPTLPEPEEPTSLKELVQAARRRLRSERVRFETDELRARRFLVDRVRTGIRL